MSSSIMVPVLLTCSSYKVGNLRSLADGARKLEGVRPGGDDAHEANELSNSFHYRFFEDWGTSVNQFSNK